VLIVLGVASGLLTAVKFAAVWGLRKANRVGPELLLVALLLLSIGYSWSVDAFGWPTPVSLARSSGLLTETAGLWRLVGIAVGTNVVVMTVLIRSGAVRRLERWSREPD
jgi:hypothetical protein